MFVTTLYRNKSVLLPIVALAVGVVGTLGVQRVRAAGIPATEVLTYSGQLLLADGTPVNGPRNIALAVYDAAVAGNRVCDVVSSEVVIVDGRFQIPLGDACVVAVRTFPDLWVDVQVDGATVGRSKLGAVPYAVQAAEASAAVGVLAQQVVPTGAVMAFDLAKCPPGWTELEAARGRTLIGVTAGLARGTPVGSNSVALTVAQMPAHSHTGTTGAGNAMSYRVVGTTGLAASGNHVNGWTGTANFTDVKTTTGRCRCTRIRSRQLPRAPALHSITGKTRFRSCIARRASSRSPHFALS
ncbi:MAG: hypothetical protein ACOY0T_20355 [Myxococcota bacterium]